MLFVCGQRGQVSFDRRAFAPGCLEDLHLESQALAHVHPEVTELAETRSQHLVPGAQAVRQCRFPAAGAGRWKQDGCAGCGLEYRLQSGEAGAGQLGKERGAVVLHRNRHGAQDTVGDVGGSGNEQEIAAGHRSLLIRM